jgi:hypothetical protein
VDRLSGWSIKGERKVVVPQRVRVQAEMRAVELKRRARKLGEMAIKGSNVWPADPGLSQASVLRASTQDVLPIV